MKLLVAFVLSLALLPGQSRPTLANTSKYVGGGRYDWNLFVRADPAVLDSIRYVEYYLHPTFPNPVQRVDRREGGFALRSNGWGEFQVTAMVAYRDGRSERLVHWLRFGGAMRAETPPKPVSRKLEPRNDSEPDGRGQWRWTIYLAGEDRVLDEVACVEYTLHPTFPEPVQRRCIKGRVAGQGFHLRASGWGTFLVQVKVEFKDKQVQYLKHQLEFKLAR